MAEQMDILDRYGSDGQRLLLMLRDITASDDSRREFLRLLDDDRQFSSGTRERLRLMREIINGTTARNIQRLLDNDDGAEISGPLREMLDGVSLNGDDDKVYLA